MPDPRQLPIGPTGISPKRDMPRDVYGIMNQPPPPPPTLANPPSMAGDLNPMGLPVHGGNGAKSHDSTKDSRNKWKLPKRK